jgi:hydrogenase-4 transcriptional activator
MSRHEFQFQTAVRDSLSSSRTEPEREISEGQQAILLSKVTVTLSWVLANLKNVAASDEQFSEICSELESLSTRLNSLAKRRLPAPANVKAMEASGGTLRQIGANPRHQLTYCSPKMHAVMDRIERAAKRDVPILIIGETGVGKELIARFIHISSRRNRSPLIPINCAAIPRELFESQFFGHKQGAFTGALREYAGIVRSAAGGTLFLDEIGELPLDLQPKLLRFLQEGEVHPVGDSLPTRVDVRVIASTNRNLEAEVKAGKFRADLLHRLNIVSFEIPPLRERREDILLLLNFYLDRYSCLPGNHKVQFAPDALDCLTAYSWPGNVRELSSLILQLVSLAEEDTIIFPSDLPAEITAPGGALADEDCPHCCSAEPTQGVNKDTSDLPLGEAVSILERQRVYDALLKNNWSFSRAARQLGLSTYGLRKKYRRLFGNEPVAGVTEE